MQNALINLVTILGVASGLTGLFFTYKSYKKPNQNTNTKKSGLFTIKQYETGEKKAIVNRRQHDNGIPPETFTFKSLSQTDRKKS